MHKLAQSRLSPLILGVFALTLIGASAISLTLFHHLSRQNAKLDLALVALSGQGDIISQGSAQNAQNNGMNGDALAALAKQRNAIRDAEVHFKTQVQEWKNTVLRGADAETRAKYWKAFNKESDEVQAIIASVAERPAASGAEGVLKYFDSAHAAMKVKYTESYGLFDGGQGKDFKGADAHVKGQDRAPAASLDSLVDIYGAAIQAYAEAEKQAFAKTRNHLIVYSALAALAVAALLVVLLSVLERHTLQPLNRALALMESMAQGNLQVSAVAEVRNEAGRLLEAASKAAASLRELLTGTTRRFQELAASSEQLLGVSNGLNDGANKTHDQIEAMRNRTQAVNQQVQSVAAATEEMGVCIQEIAQNAQAAANQSTTAAGEAETVSQGLSEVSQASGKIEDILLVIQRIAEQTHLLALNSSIEAARAGEAGKGFNVVAHEIKELSHSTSEATAQIQQRIANLRGSVEGMTGKMGTLRTEVLSMRDRIGAIATAIEEQTNTTREIGRNIETTAQASQSIEDGAHQVEVITRSSKERAGEARTAAEALRTLSSEMDQAMKAFQI